MLVGFGSMELFTSRTMILSRKLLGLHLILWMQPIALNCNTIHNSVQSSGGGERRMDKEARKRKSPQLDHVLKKEKRKRKKPHQIFKKVFTYSRQSHKKPCIFDPKLSQRRKEPALESACFPVRKTSPNKRRCFFFQPCTDVFMLSGHKSAPPKCASSQRDLTLQQCIPLEKPRVKKKKVLS